MEPLQFPLLCLSGDETFVARRQEDLTACHPSLLSNGFFTGLLLVDSKGQTRRVREARVLRRLGSFLTSIVNGPRVEVELAFEGEPFAMPLSEIKERIEVSYESSFPITDYPDEVELSKSKEYQSVQKLLARIRAASSSHEILQILSAEED